MDDLLKRRLGNDKRKRKKEKPIVSYGLNGYAIKGKLAKWKRVCLCFTGLILAMIMFIYIPPAFYKEKSANSYIPITPDATAIKEYQTYLKDHPDDDFDKDGLNNALENEHGTDVWNMDTDGDGVSDYAELFLTETSPTDASTIMLKQMSSNDSKNGDTLGTPYKIDDIIFWPDTYQSKAYGAVVRTLKGYRFCNYEGWVRFPEPVYAYRYVNGVHYELTYREKEDAWKIEMDDEILLYAEPLQYVNRLELPFIDDIYLEDNGFGKFLSNVLPDKGGYVCCSRISTLDINPSEGFTSEAPLNSPLIDRSDVSRFAQNTNTLKDLSKVRKLIDAGKCVAVSIYSGNTGEAIGIVYGYTENGNLLVANESLKPVGEIVITEYAMRMMDKEGTIGQISWFEWSGLGFDSRENKDRINFFASTITGVNNSVPETPLINEDSTETELAEKETDTEQQIQQEMQTEISTEQESQDEAKIQSKIDSETPVQEEIQSEKQTEINIQPETTVDMTEQVNQQDILETEKNDTVITFGF